MTHRMLVAVLFLLIASSGGITQSSAQGSENVVADQSPLGFGRVFVYRFGNPRSIFRPTIRVDGQPFGRALPNSYFYVDLPVGSYGISGAIKTKWITELEVSEGQDSYVQIETNLDARNQAVYPIVMDAKLGKQHVKRLGYDDTESDSVKYDVVAVIGETDLAIGLCQLLASPDRRVILGVPGSDEVRRGAILQDSKIIAAITTPEKAAMSADVLFFDVPRRDLRAVSGSIGDLSGKVIVDVSFAWEQDKDGYPALISDESGAELLQNWYPEALVVGAFIQPNAWQRDESIDNVESGDVVIASDSQQAKLRLTELLSGASFELRDLGNLRMSHHIEQLQLIRIVPMLQGRAYGYEIVIRQTSGIR